MDRIDEILFLYEDDVVEMADGGRIGYKVGDLVSEDVTPQTESSRKSKERKGVKSVRRESPILKRISKGKSKYWPFKSETILISQEDIDNAFEVRNYIVKNKGFVANADDLGQKLNIITPTGKTNPKQVNKAVVLAMDTFKEVEDFKFAKDRYPKIGEKKFRFLDMMSKSFADYNLTKDPIEAASHLLKDNMAMNYDLKLGKENLDKSFFRLGKITPEDKTFISQRVSALTGKSFPYSEVDKLLKETTKVRTATGTFEAKLKRNANMNKQIKDIADDTQIKNLLAKPFNRETQTALLNRATDIVGGDASIASRRLFQMAEAMSDTTDMYKNLGIKTNNNIANKIIATGKEIGGRNNRYGMSSILYDYYGNIVDKALGATEGKTFIGKYQQGIRNLLDKGQSPDEIFSLTASAKRGLSPYAIFTQQLRTDVNSSIKGAFIDSALSKKHDQLQQIFKGRTYDKLNTAEKRAVQGIVDDFEKIKKDALNKPVNPGAVREGAKPIYLTAAEKKKIQLPEFDLKNPPSKSIEGFEDRFKKYPKIKKAFEESYAKVGYGMKVPKEFETQKQVIERLGCPGKGRVKNSTGGSCYTKGIEKLRGDPTKYSPGDQANVRKLAKAAAKGGRVALFLKNVLGPAAITGELIFEGGVAANKFMEGMPIKQALGESYINKYILGPKTQIDLEAERAKEMERGEEFAMAERGRRKAPFMAQGEYADRLRRKKRMEEMEQAFPTTSPERIDEILASQNLTVEDTGLDYGRIQDIIKRDDQMQAIADAGGVANMAGGGIAGIRKPDAIPPESGPNPQGLENLKYYVTNT